VFGTAPRPELVTIVALALAAAATLPAPALLAALVVVALLAGLVAVEHVKALDAQDAAGGHLSSSAVEPAA
jgi:hypothetical protein